MMYKSIIRYALVRTLITALIVTALPTQVYAASMRDYCLLPPYIKSDVPPNIVILMDNSNDMLKSAYIKTEKNYNSAPASTYDGYFENTKYYEYDNDNLGKKFMVTGLITSSSNTAATVTVSNLSGTTTILYRGSLLNWATTSRFDLLQKVLTGGKASGAPSNNFTMESYSGKWNKTYNGCKFSRSFWGRCESAGINRHRAGDERALRERTS